MRESAENKVVMGTFLLASLASRLFRLSTFSVVQDSRTMIALPMRHRQHFIPVHRSDDAL